VELTSEYLTALAALISAIAWPAIVLFILIAFRHRIERSLEEVESLVLPGGIEAKFRRTLDREAEAVIQAKEAEPENAPSRQLQAAQRVEQLAESRGPTFARQQMLGIAREYEVVRASMSPGDRRTREMEKIVTKMRTLGLATRDSLAEFMDSTSPGARLAAIAILQVQPSPDTLIWLSERFRIEQPFVAYHAAVALLVSARVLGPEHADSLRVSIERAQEYLGAGREQSDRYRVLQDALNEVNSNAR
jgi:hypothetical protein